MLAVGVDEDEREQLRADLAHRFDRDYETMSSTSGAASERLLAGLAEAGRSIALVFAPARDGELTTALFAAARARYPMCGVS
jgi:hypothetical protein